MTNTTKITKEEEKKSASAKTSVKKTETKNKKTASEFFRQYIRVLKLARKPTKEEFWKICGITAIGILIVGMLGFLIYLLFYYLLP